MVGHILARDMRSTTRSLAMRLAVVILMALAVVAGPATTAWSADAVVAPSPSLASAAASPGALPSVEPRGPQLVYVPVLRFWTPRRDISLEDVRAAIEGRHDDFRRVLVAGADPSPLWLALGVTPAATTESATAAQIERAVGSSRRVLGLVPAGEVRPTVRALSVDGVSLFGGQRIAGLENWPLAASVPDPQRAGRFEPTAIWTLAAGGDVMLDREVYRQAVILGKGPHYPWKGGYAEITSRTCCTADGGNAITTRRTQPRGALRKLLSAADIAVVNHEGPAPDRHSYHPSGFTFTFDPALLEGVARAGVDLVSLANNHIRNAGSAGVRQTIRNLRRAGIRSVGAGKDPQQARRGTCLQTQVHVCFLAYDAINVAVHAVRPGRPGAAELIMRDVRADIRRLRREGADVIAVMPHWGAEYVTSVTAEQRRWARAMVRAGADVVLGAHSHVAGPLEFIDGAPVLYSLGDLIFDLPRFEATEEGVIAELTFDGPRLAQIDLHPTVIVARSQVNLLDPSKDGRVVLQRMKRASDRLD